MLVSLRIGRRALCRFSSAPVRLFLTCSQDAMQELVACLSLENAKRSTFEAALRPNFTCSPGLGSTAAVQLAVDAAATAPPRIYRDEFTYDMSKRTSFVGAARVKVASLPGAGGPINMNMVISQLKEAKADGALIATLTEESFGYSGNDPGQPIDGPGPTAVRQAAKDIGIAVVCPMRLLAADGRQFVRC